MEHQVKAYAFIAPSLLILTVFVFIPLAGAIGISLMNIDIYMKNISFAGIANYIKMFQDERVANATFHTFYFALLEVPLQMIVALLLLMFMLRNTKLHKLLRTVFYLPYVCSMTAVSIMWSMLLNTHYGMLPYLLGKIGITMPNMLSSMTWAMPTVIFVTVWKGFGYTLTILSAAALGVSESLYEAAEIDGASAAQRFRHVTWPLLSPTTFFVLIIANFGAALLQSRGAAILCSEGVELLLGRFAQRGGTGMGFDFTPLIFFFVADLLYTSIGRVLLQLMYTPFLN